MTIAVLRQQLSSRTRIRGTFLRIVNAVILMIASRSDRVTEIYFSSNNARHVKSMSPTVNEVNNNITKVLDEFIFCRVLHVCFNA